MPKRLLLMCLLVPCVAQAQPADSLTRVLNRFNTGAAIQINESRGHFFGVKNGAVVFEGSDNVRDVALSNINQVWKQRSYAKTGAITGGVITGVTFAVLGGLVVRVSCEDVESHCHNDYPIVAAWGLLLGGAGGGLVGGLIGYAFKKWVQVY